MHEVQIPLLQFTCFDLLLEEKPSMYPTTELRAPASMIGSQWSQAHSNFPDIDLLLFSLIQTHRICFGKMTPAQEIHRLKLAQKMEQRIKEERTAPWHHPTSHPQIEGYPEP